MATFLCRHFRMKLLFCRSFSVKRKNNDASFDTGTSMSKKPCMREVLRKTEKKKIFT